LVASLDAELVTFNDERMLLGFGILLAFALAGNCGPGSLKLLLVLLVRGVVRDRDGCETDHGERRDNRQYEPSHGRPPQMRKGERGELRRAPGRGQAAALAELPEANREALVMHYCQNQPLAEIATKLDRTPAAVAGLLKRGLRELRGKLREE